jgi:hypothetical protein
MTLLSGADNSVLDVVDNLRGVLRRCILSAHFSLSPPGPIGQEVFY